MKKTLNLPHLIFYGVGMILGAGIYSVIGKAAGIAHDSLWLSFLVAAVSASLTALSYAELATMFPRAGGEYIYIKNIFPNLNFLAMICGSMMIFAGISTATTVAIAFSGYLQQFVSVSWYWVAVGALGFFTLLNIIGIKESSWFNILFTIIELAGLIIFILVGLQAPEFGEALTTATFDGRVITGASLVIFAYFGFETIVNLVEETKEPEKQIPKAIIFSLCVSTFLYFLVSLAALALGTPQELHASAAPFSDLTKGPYPQIAKVLGGIALFSTANTVLISMLGTSRVIFSMARERDLPTFLAKLLPKRQTPWMAAILVFVLAVSLLPVGGIEVIASASSFATMLAFFIINYALIYYRFKKPNVKRPFKVPLSFGKVPVPTVLAGLISMVLMFFFSVEVYLLSGLVIIIILGLYVVQNKFYSRP